MYGLLMVLAIVLIAVCAPLIAPYDPQKNVEATTADFLAAPSPGHILGQDDAGKDVFSSVIYGARVSLLVGLAASFLIVAIGTTLGMIAGYFGGRLDTLIMRFVDAEGDPQCRHLANEQEQESFDTTCKKLFEHVTMPKEKDLRPSTRQNV